jgi:osmotically inducible protein OsmC
MPVRTASAEWKGDLPTGKGTLETESGAVKGGYSFPSRFENGPGTNPEELVAAAHAGCFSMALSHALAQAGFTPTSVATTAKVHLEKGDEGFGIPRIDLICEAVVPGLDEDGFAEHARGAKEGCPVSKLLTGAEISLEAKLLG